MTREETNRMIQLLEAQANGKQIQAKPHLGKKYEDIEIVSKFCYQTTYELRHHEDIENIRIKPEVKYLPYDLKDLTYFMIQGTEFVYNKTGDKYIITAVYKSGFVNMDRVEGGGTGIMTPFTTDLCKVFTLDGHPAGNPVEVENE